MINLNVVGGYRGYTTTLQQKPTLRFTSESATPNLQEPKQLSDIHPILGNGAPTPANIEVMSSLENPRIVNISETGIALISYGGAFAILDTDNNTVALVETKDAACLDKDGKLRGGSFELC